MFEIFYVSFEGLRVKWCFWHTLGPRPFVPASPLSYYWLDKLFVNFLSLSPDETLGFLTYFIFSNTVFNQSDVFFNHWKYGWKLVKRTQTNSNFKTTKTSIFHISLKFTNPLRKTISSQKYPKISKTSYNIDCLKCERDISIEVMLSGGKIAFR